MTKNALNLGPQWASEVLRSLEMLTLVHACSHMCVFLKKKEHGFHRVSQHSPKIKTMIIRARGVALHHPLMLGTLEEVRCGLSQQKQQTLFYLTSRALSPSVCTSIFASK